MWGQYWISSPTAVVSSSYKQFQISSHYFLKVVVCQAPENTPWLHCGFPVFGMVGIWLSSGLMIIAGSPLRFYEKQFSSLMRKVPWEALFGLPHSPFLPGMLLGRRGQSLAFLEGFVTTCSWASYLIVSYSEMFICTSGCLILVLEAALNSSMSGLCESIVTTTLVS